jgi:hypothetical protein
MTTTDSRSAGHTIAIYGGMTAHSSPISGSSSPIVFGIVEFPSGGRAVYRVAVGKEI